MTEEHGLGANLRGANHNTYTRWPDDWTPEKGRAGGDVVTAEPVYASFLERLVEGRTLPPGCDTWGIKTVRPDGRTYDDYQWPLSPKIVKATNVDRTNTGACPAREGDGLCVASSHYGMASGGIPARTLLLLAYHTRDVLGSAIGKCRVSKVLVVDVIDGERAVREHGRGANLFAANLRGADLRGADLRGADLRGANLYGADLRGAKHDTFTRWPDGWTPEKIATAVQR